MGALKSIGILFLIQLGWGCQTMQPIHTVESVDLKRFMGDWYVIASIPTFIRPMLITGLNPTNWPRTAPLKPPSDSTGVGFKGRSKPTRRGGLLRTSNPTLSGVCSSYGHSKQNTESFTCPMIMGKP